MNTRKFLPMVSLFAVVALLAACHGNPAVRKQKYLESGKRYSAEGKYREAAIQFLNALKVDDEFVPAYYELAQTYKQLGEPDEACSELARAVALRPEDYAVRMELGNLLLSTGRVTEAQAQADALVELEPNSAGTHALISAIAYRSGQKELALAEIQRALELDSSQAIYHENLAVIEGDDPSKSRLVEAELQKAIALDPRMLNARILLSAFYEKTGRLPEAEKTAWDAVAAAPASLNARESVAWITFRRGDSAKAEQILRQTANDLAATPGGPAVLADFYFNTAQLDKARTEFAGLLGKYPKDSIVQKGYIRVLLATKDFNTARSVIAGIVKRTPDDPDFAALNGIVLLSSDDASSAIAALQQSEKRFPRNAEIQYWLGKAALAQGNSELAEQSFRMAANLNPSALEPHQELARIAAQRGDFALLAGAAEKVIAASPNEPQGYVWRAIVEMNRNSVDKAEADLKTAMQIAPDNLEAGLELGKLRFRQKRFAEGIPLLENTLKRNPDSVEAMRLLVNYDLNQKNPQKALARLNAQIARSPRNSHFDDLLAEVQIQTRKLDQASVSAERAFQLDSSDSEAVLLIAQLAILRGQTANAIATWEQAATRHSGNPGILAILGTLEESRGNLDKAETYYEKSLQIQPRQPVAANNLACRMLLKGGKPQEALTLAKAAHQAMPDSPNTADTLAWAYYFNGDFEVARNLLEDAVGANQNSAPMHYHLGMVYSKLRDKQGAQIQLKKALALAPDAQTAKEAREALRGLG